MATVGELIVRFGLDTSAFSTGIERLNKDLGAMQREVTRNFGNIQAAADKLQSVGTALSAAITLPVVAFGAAAVKISEQFTAAQIGFTTMLGSGEKAASFLKDLQKFASETPFEFRDLTSAAQRMMALGLKSQDVLPMLRAVGDQVAASGTLSKDAIDGIILALAQMQGKQKVSAQEMTQLAERGVPAWEILAKAIGTSVPEAMKLAEKGVIQAGVAIPALLEGMRGKTEGSMQKMSQTLSGVWSNFQDKAAMTLSKMGGTLAPVVLSLVQNALLPLLEALNNAVTWFTELPEPIQWVIGGIVGLATAIGPVLLGLATFGQAIISIKGGLAIIGPALTGWNAAMNISVGAMAGWVVGIGVAVAAVYALTSALNSTQDAQRGLQAAQQTQASGLVKLRESLLNNKNATAENKEEIHRLGEAYRTGAVSETKYLQGLQKIALEIGSKVVPGIKVLTKEELALIDLQKRIQESLAGTQKAHKKTAEEVAALKNEAKLAKIEFDKWKTSNDAFEKSYDKVNNDALAKSKLNAAEAVVSLSEFGEKLLDAASKGNAAHVALSPLLITLGELKSPTNELRKALDELGVQSATSLEAVAINAERAYEAIVQSGKATQWEKDSALVKVLEAQIAAAKAAGRTIPAEWETMLESLKNRTQVNLNGAKKSWENFSREVSTVITNFTQDISRSLFDGDMSWGSKGKKMLRDLGAAVTSLFLQPATAAITKFIATSLSKLLGKEGFGGLFNSLKGIGDKISSIFKNVPGLPGSNSTPSINTPGTGGIGSLFGSGVTGVLGAVGSVGSMISGIIGNFQNARQETTLNAIEWNTRKASLHLEHLLTKANEIWPTIDQIHSRMWAWTGEGLGVKQFGEWKFPAVTIQQPPIVDVTPSALSSTTIGTQINLAGANILTPRALDEFVDLLVARMRVRGAIA